MAPGASLQQHAAHLSHQEGNDEDDAPGCLLHTGDRGAEPRCTEAKAALRFLKVAVFFKSNVLSYHDDEEVKHIHPAQLALDQRHQILGSDGDMSQGQRLQAADPPHLSGSCSDAPGSVHDSGDSGQRFLAAPQSFLSAQVCRYGGADHGGRAADEAASVGQEDGVYHLVVGRA